MKLNEMRNENLELVTGGAVKVNPIGSCKTEDKYYIVDDQTGVILAMTGGYRVARKLAASRGQAPGLI